MAVCNFLTIEEILGVAITSKKVSKVYAKDNIILKRILKELLNVRLLHDRNVIRIIFQKEYYVSIRKYFSSTKWIRIISSVEAHTKMIRTCNRKVLTYKNLNCMRTIVGCDERKIWNYVSTVIQNGSVTFIPMNEGIIIPNQLFTLRTHSEFVSLFNERFKLSIWSPGINWDSWIIAGGSVVTTLVKELQQDTSSDVDLFSIGLDRWEYIAHLARLETYLRCHNISFRCYSKDKIVTYFIRNISTATDVKLQMIWHGARVRPYDILNSFDISPVQVAYQPIATNEERIMMTYGFQYWINTGFATQYTTTQRCVGAIRLAKYIQRGVILWRISVLKRLVKFARHITRHYPQSGQTETPHWTWWASGTVQFTGNDDRCHVMRFISDLLKQDLLNI